MAQPKKTMNIGKRKNLWKVPGVKLGSLQVRSTVRQSQWEHKQMYQRDSEDGAREAWRRATPVRLPAESSASPGTLARPPRLCALANQGSEGAMAEGGPDPPYFLYRP